MRYLLDTNACIGHLTRILEPVGRCLTLDVARALVEVRMDPATLARVEELADRCTEDKLTAAEHAEYEAYVSAIDFVGVLQARARKLLAGIAST